MHQMWTGRQCLLTYMKVLVQLSVLACLLTMYPHFFSCHWLAVFAASSLLLTFYEVSSSVQCWWTHSLRILQGVTSAFLFVSLAQTPTTFLGFCQMQHRGASWRSGHCGHCASRRKTSGLDAKIDTLWYLQMPLFHMMLTMCITQYGSSSYVGWWKFKIAACTLV